ncbi:MAG: hypothetical protein WD048_06240 [Chitinophagales bacterium]
MEIKYLKREAIEDKKWNGCVHFALNSLPYGYTWYLDNVAETWDGLVLGDYRAVMPLPWNKKLKWKYIYTPIFAQQLGVFSLKPISQNLLKLFIDAIPEEFALVDQNINFMNPFLRSDFQRWEKTNLELSLQNDYESIRKNYSKNTLRNLKKAEKNQLRITNNVKPETLVSFFKTHIGQNLDFMRNADYHTLHRIIYQSMHYGMAGTYGVYSKENHLVATAYFIYGKSRMINLLPASNDYGKSIGAMTQLYDYIIRANCEKKFTLDFEGSMIPSIARYYKGFGAEAVKYWQIKRNQLPWYIKWFKQ